MYWLLSAELPSALLWKIPPDIIRTDPEASDALTKPPIVENPFDEEIIPDALTATVFIVPLELIFSNVLVPAITKPEPEMYPLALIFPEAVIWPPSLLRNTKFDALPPLTHICPLAEISVVLIEAFAKLKLAAVIVPLALIFPLAVMSVTADLNQ